MAKQLTYRVINAEVAATMGELLVETGRLSTLSSALLTLVPSRPAPLGWGERGGAAWAGLLKRLETRLRAQRPEYATLHMTASDGQRTWRVPLAVTVHLVTEKILSVQRAAPLLRRDGRLHGS